MMEETWMAYLSVWASSISEPQMTLDCGHNQNARAAERLTITTYVHLTIFMIFSTWKQINQMCEVNSLCHLYQLLILQVFFFPKEPTAIKDNLIQE